MRALLCLEQASSYSADEAVPWSSGTQFVDKWQVMHWSRAKHGSTTSISTCLCDGDQPDVLSTRSMILHSIYVLHSYLSGNFFFCQPPNGWWRLCDMEYPSVRFSSVHNWSSVLTKGFCICQNQDATLPLTAVRAPLNWQLLWFWFHSMMGVVLKLEIFCQFQNLMKSFQLFSQQFCQNSGLWHVFKMLLSNFAKLDSRCIHWAKLSKYHGCQYWTPSFLVLRLPSFCQSCRS